MNRDLPHLPAVRRTTRIVRGIVAAVASAALFCSLTSVAVADELDDRKAELQQELVQQAGAVQDASAELDAAVDRPPACQDARLADAEAALAKAESEAA